MWFVVLYTYFLSLQLILPDAVHFPWLNCCVIVQVRVENYAEYRSLPKEVALRLVPRDGKTRYGETLLKPYLDADHVDRLCSAFARETDG